MKHLRILTVVVVIFSILSSFVLFPQPIRAAPADCYWVGDGGNWTDALNHWAVASGGAPGAGNLPDATSNVHFDANSFTAGGQTVTVDAPASCLNMDWTGATNTPTFAHSNTVAPRGSATFIADMVTTGVSTFFFSGVGAANLTTNGLTLSFTIGLNNAALVLTLQDDLTGYSIYFNQGTLVTNNNTITVDAVTFPGAAAKVLTLGSSTVNCTSWNYSGTNLTLTANTATIKVAGTGVFSGGSIATYHDVELNGTSHTVSGDNTFNKLTIANSVNITVTGGSTQTFADLEAGTNVTLQSTGGNYNLILTGATATGVGSGLTMTDATVTAPGAPANKRYWVQNGGNWTDDNNHWSLLSGFLPAGATVQIPTAADDVYFDANSFYSGGQTVNLDANADCRGMDWTGVAFFPSIGGANTLSISQDLVLSPNIVTYNPSQTIFVSASNITTNGNDMGAVNFNGTVYIFLDAFYSTGAVAHTIGTLTTNNFAFTAGELSFPTAGAKILNLGSSIVTTLDPNGWNYSGSNLVLNEGTSTIVIEGTGQFVGGSETYNDVELNGTAHTISGSNIFDTLTFALGNTQTITFTDGTTQTITTPILSGSAGNIHTLQGSGVAGWDMISGGEVELEYLDVSDSTVNPPFWYAGNSVDGGGNVNWRFGYRGMDENSGAYLLISLSTLILVGMLIFVLLKIFTGAELGAMTILVAGIVIYVFFALLPSIQAAITGLLTR